MGGESLYASSSGNLRHSSTTMSAAANALAELQHTYTTTRQQALKFYDSLPPVLLSQLRGSRWRGTELPTGHPMDGLLTRLHWYGKSFGHSDNDVQALLFHTADDSIAAVNPALIPLSLFAAYPPLLHWWVTAAVWPLWRSLIGARGPTARLRMVEHRGVVSAGMVYDCQPIVDSFRCVDGDTVLGVMDYRDMPEPYFFVLRRDGETGAAT